MLGLIRVRRSVTRATFVSLCILLFAPGMGVLGDALADPASVWDFEVSAKISDLNLPPDILEGKWEVSPGFRVDDLSDLSGLKGQEKVTAETLGKQLLPLGIRSAGDFSLLSGSNVVTVRIFIFEKAPQCRAWWKKKYQYEGWEEHYRAVSADSWLAFDSLQMNKRVMAFGNVWVTTHQLEDGNEHLVAARHLMQQLQERDESKNMKDLGSLQWKNRVVLVLGPSSMVDEAATKLRAASEEVSERAILWFGVSEGGLQTNYTHPLADGFEAHLVEIYRSAEEAAEVVLIGKDGGVKNRYPNLDIQEICERIDSMPMRQAEMGNP